MASSNNLPQPQFLYSHSHVYLAWAESREHHPSLGTWRVSLILSWGWGDPPTDSGAALWDQEAGCAHHETNSWQLPGLPGWHRAPPCQGSSTLPRERQQAPQGRRALTHCPVPFFPPLFRAQFAAVMERTRSVSACLAVGNGSGLTFVWPHLFFWQTHLTLSML